MSESSSGHLNWSGWALEYGVFGKEGLCLVDGYFRGQRVFNKLSLPVIRVKYTRDKVIDVLSPLTGTSCGPYNDQITWDTEDPLKIDIPGPYHLKKLDCPGGDRYICIDEVDIGGVTNKRLAVYARIGAYHISQQWMLDGDGLIRPRISSKGLSCNLDHWHHPYWRFDFALGNPEIQNATVQYTNGTHLRNLDTEGPLVITDLAVDPIEFCITSAAGTDVGFIEVPAQATVRPPDLDHDAGIVGPTDFAPLDGYVRTYKPAEDRDWPHPPARDISFGSDGSCQNSDIVLWFIGHLEHHADEGEDHWHTVGPDIRITPMQIVGVPPEHYRAITVEGHMHVKDFGVFEDETNSLDFSRTLHVEPNVPFQEVVEKIAVGDVTAELKVRAEWQSDHRIKIATTSNLFDGLERTAHAEAGFDVNPGGTATWNFHLVDHHGGDPDTGDMSFTVTNEQA